MNGMYGIYKAIFFSTLRYGNKCQANKKLSKTDDKWAMEARKIVTIKETLG